MLLGALWGANQWLAVGRSRLAAFRARLIRPSFHHDRPRRPPGRHSNAESCKFLDRAVPQWQKKLYSCQTATPMSIYCRQRGFAARRWGKLFFMQERPRAHHATTLYIGIDKGDAFPLIAGMIDFLIA